MKREREEFVTQNAHLPCGGNMMLMDGQLSHTGFDARCRLLSALLAVEDEVCEDIDQTERPATE